jgi:hypothetical protein
MKNTEGPLPKNLIPKTTQITRIFLILIFKIRIKIINQIKLCV